MSKSKLTFAQKTLYYTLLALMRCVAILPDFILCTIFKPLLYVLTYHVARYRVKVVRDNLEQCFPQKTPKELRSIERKFYWFFAELLLNILNLTIITPRKLARCIKVKSGCENFATDQRPIIVMLAHYGCWELLAGFTMPQYGFHTICVYHELENPVADKIMRFIRERLGGIPVERREVLRYCVANRNGYPDGGRMLWGMISDQTPARDLKHHWLKFMGRPTVFARGSEYMAVKFDMPVYFLWVDKVGFGRYEYRFEMIYDGKEEVDEYEITERYAKLLERQINTQPEYWLWTHRRWKRPFCDAARQNYYERYPEDCPNEG